MVEVGGEGRSQLIDSGVPPSTPRAALLTRIRTIGFLGDLSLDKMFRKVEPRCRPCCASRLLRDPSQAPCAPWASAPHPGEKGVDAKFCASPLWVHGICSRGRVGVSLVTSAWARVERGHLPFPLSEKQVRCLSLGLQPRGSRRQYIGVTPASEGRLCNFR